MSRLRLFLVVFACGLFWTILGLALGAVLHHPLGGFVCGVLVGVVYNAVGSWAADKFPGDVWDAKLLENSSAPNLYEMLHALCSRTGQALPTLYSIPRSEPNAFVTAGRDGETAILVTHGLTHLLEKEEVQAILALMMARLATGAMPGWTLTATLAGMPLQIGLQCWRGNRLAWLGSAVLSVFASPAAALTWLIWDEGTLTAADYHAAHLAEQAGSLQRALTKIESQVTQAGMKSGNPATALLFAVPPLLPQGENAPRWQRGLASFPSRLPDASGRAARFSEVVPSYVPEAVEEFRNW